MASRSLPFRMLVGTACLIFGQLASAQQAGNGGPRPFGAVHAVDPAVRYHRFIALVHLTGSGKKDDPRVPEYAPATLDGGRSGIISWSMQLADDGKMAIVHYVAVDPKAFEPIRGDKRPEVRVFEIGKDKPEEIEREMRKFKKDFTLDSLRVVAQ